MDFSANIELRYFTDEWGPYSVDLTGGLPDGDTIADVTIKVYSGRVTPAADLTDLTDLASQVIENGSIGFSDLSVWWTMQYPVDAALKSQKFTLIFEVTTSTGGKHPFYLYRVKVK